MDNKAQPTKRHHIPKETVLLQAAIPILEGYGIPVEIIPQKTKPANSVHTDGALRLTLDGRQQTFFVEVKRWLTPATLGQVITRLGNLGKSALLVTDYATPAVAEKFKELDIPFVDTAGNIYLRRPPVYLWITGRKPIETERPRRAGRAFQPMGLKLVFALLCKPDLVQEPVRDIAAFAGVAHGTVGIVINELRELGCVTERGTQRARVRKLHNLNKLLTQWSEAYARTLRPQLLIGRFEAADFDWWKKLDPRKYDVLLGAEPAAAIATKHLRPGIVTVYTHNIPPRMMIDYRIRKAEQGTIELRRRFWPFDYDWGFPTLTPPVLIYADLLATGDGRCIETAQLLYEKYLTRFIKED